MTPTPEQEAILAEIKGSKQSLLINALAGAAKTTTLCLIAKKLPLVPTISVAFNKRIATEMQARLPGHIESMTLNSLGHRVWGARLGKRLIVNADKMYDILKRIGDTVPGHEKERWGEMFTSLLRAARLAKSAGYVPQSFSSMGQSLITGGELEDALAVQCDVNPDQEFLGYLDRALEMSIAEAFEARIDFDDQIYMSCQPAGTMVTVKVKGKQEWLQVPIEEVTDNDQVVTFDRKLSKFTGMYSHASCVEAVASREYTGQLFQVEAGDKHTRATQDHKWLVRFKPDLAGQELFFTYLMLREGSYKIGIAQTRSARPDCSDGFGLAVRCGQEKAEAAWLLGVHDSREEALLIEAMLVATHGITDRCFENDTIGAVVHGLQRNWQMRERAERCLAAFGRLHSFPFWTPQATRAFNSNFITQSCNLIPEIMEVPVFRDSSKPDWQPIWLDSWPVVNVKVYSLQVARHELYIADGVLTHNCLFGGVYPQYPIVMVDEAQDLSPLNHASLEKLLKPGGRLIAVGDPFQAIYAFRGAKIGSMSALKETFSMAEMGLSVSFRCPRAVVERARLHVPHMQYPEWAIEGEVRHIPGEELDPATFPDGSFIICRNNAPLFRAAMWLIRNQRSIKLVGSDLGASLVKLMRKLGPADTSADTAIELARRWRDAEVAKAHPARVAAIHDKAECIVTFLRESGTLGEAVMRAESLFAQSGTIKLMTGHKSKGDETDTVYHLDFFLIPGKWARKAAEEGDTSQMEQELNLRYVIETRAKRELFLIESEDMK